MVLALVEKLLPPLCWQMPPDVVDGQGDADRPQAANEKPRKNRHRSIMPDAGCGDVHKAGGRLERVAG